MTEYDPRNCGRRIPPEADGVPCKRAGVYCPTLLAWVNPLKTHAPLTMFLGLSVCEECSKDLIVDDFVTDEGWQRIVDMMTEAGKAAPDRSTARLKLTPIAEVPEWFLKKSDAQKQGER